MEMSAVLLSIFFTTGVSQNGFNVILRFTDLIMKSCNVPKRFDDCVKILLKDNNDTIKLCFVYVVRRKLFKKKYVRNNEIAKLVKQS
jgi:hypothetical protein